MTRMTETEIEEYMENGGINYAFGTENDTISEGDTSELYGGLFTELDDAMRMGQKLADIYGETIYVMEYHGDDYVNRYWTVEPDIDEDEDDQD